MKKNLILLLWTALLFIGCSKDDDNIFSPPQDLASQDFMWKASNYWYFWQDDVPNLADDRFASDEEYTAFLESDADAGDFFDNQLRFTEDRFTFYSPDYEEFTKILSGITKNNGLNFGLILLEGDLLVGYVRYIIPDSDAASKQIFRGNYFTEVDGQRLDTNNYIDLLFGENDTYTLSMADYVNDEFTPNGLEVMLTKEENFQENPVYITNTLDVNGTKIGYIFYRRFTDGFEDELNAAFGQLQAQGITELVLDLRYNPGGRVSSAVALASMIYGTNTNELFVKQRWNPKRQAGFSASSLEENFINQIEGGEAINSLGLSRIYVLTTERSASASELLINGLDPYMNVIQVGTTTTGKNEFSLTMVDDPGNNFPYTYDPARESFINPNNSWAIQMLCGRYENSVGFSDFTTGLVPEIELEEDVLNLGALGDINEPLLARAIEDITGVSGKRDFTVRMPAKAFADSDTFDPVRDVMIGGVPSGIEQK
ncbi:S41 family peptidase [Muriicola sp. E247]|uniref:S41 family peptidase n=1 Tax=Muriicola sp. E247 TaxID=3242730 RepID=UPI003523B870